MAHILKPGSKRGYDITEALTGMPVITWQRETRVVIFKTGELNRAQDIHGYVRHLRP